MKWLPSLLAAASLALCCAPAHAQPMGADALAPRPIAEPGWLGITISWDDEHGQVRVLQALPNSPARIAGVPPNARIATIDGETVDSVDAFIGRVSGRPAGTVVRLSVVVGDEARTFEIALGARPSVGQLSSLMEGELVPELAVQDARTEASSSLLADEGRVHVVEFWATWCGPCRAVRPQMVEMHDELSPHGLQIVAVSGEESADVVRYLDDHPAPYRVAVDPEGTVSAELLAMALPTWFVIDGDRRIVAVHSGSNEMPQVRRAVEALLAADEPDP